MKKRLIFLVLSAFIFLSACSTIQRSSEKLAEKVDFGTRLEWKLARRVEKKLRAADPDYRPRYPEKAWGWFYSRRMSLKDKRIPVDYRERALKHSGKYCRAPETRVANAQWTVLGPFPPRGRLKDICVDPQNDNIIYVGSASGGVWKTTDQGQNWTNLTDNKIPSLGIGSIAMDPNNASHLFIGLGEGLSSKIYEPLGSGVYKTSDGGQTWTLTPGSGNNAMQTSADLTFAGNSQTLYASCLGVYYGNERGYEGHGFFKTTNGGDNWTKIYAQRSWDVSVNHANSLNVVFSTQETDQARIYYTTDGGATINPATIPADATASRIEMARSKSNPQIMYALVGGKQRQLSGIWKSTNGGSTWVQAGVTGIPTDANEKPGQMTYNNCIAVAPGDSNKVFIGSNLRAYKTTDGAQNWSSVSYWWVPNNYNLPYVHADHHGIAFGSNDNTVLYATDGGFHISKDGGTTWEERNNGLMVTQIYRNSCSADVEKKWAIGCQDNSMYVSKDDGSWVYIPWFGDGFECIIDPTESHYVYSTGYYGKQALFSNKGGENKDVWYYLRDKNGGNGIPADEQGGWIVPFIADPLDPTVLYLGLVNIYKTKVDRKPPDQNPVQPTWTKVLSAGNSVQIMEIMRLSYGPTNRKMFLFQSRNVNQSWQLGLARANLDGTDYTQLTMPRLGFANDLACDPNNNNIVWLVYSDIGSYPDEKTRIYKSTNLGDSWTDMTNNFPLSLPISAIFIDPRDSNTIILGTDLGCYRSDNGGANWYAWSNGLPNTVVTDLAYYPPGRKIRAATYGRGLWECSIDGGGGAPDIDVQPTSVSLP